MEGRRRQWFLGFYRLVGERLNTTSASNGRGVARAVERAAGVDWWTHIIATSGKYNDRLLDIEREWSVAQLVAAHRVLDVWQEIEKPEARK